VEELRNVYFPPFHAAVNAGVGSLMSAYMDLNDLPASGNRFLLHDVLREQWGFQGFVVSDALAVGNLVTHGFARDREDAAYHGFTAGVNMDMASGTYIQNIGKLSADGKISTTQLDNAVRPLLEAKIRLGLFEHPYVDETKVEAMLDRPSSMALERKLAARSMVLLRDEGHALPLAKSVHSIAVVGPLADDASDIEGGWTVEGLFGKPKSHPVSVLAAPATDRSRRNGRDSASGRRRTQLGCGDRGRRRTRQYERRGRVPRNPHPARPTGRDARKAGGHG
jgi:beta-glucosidase